MPASSFDCFLSPDSSLLLPKDSEILIFIPLHVNQNQISKPQKYSAKETAVFCPGVINNLNYKKKQQCNNPIQKKGKSHDGCKNSNTCKPVPNAFLNTLLRHCSGCCLMSWQQASDSLAQQKFNASFFGDSSIPYCFEIISYAVFLPLTSSKPSSSSDSFRFWHRVG